MPSSLPTSKNAINVPSSPPSLSEAELLRVCLQRGREAAHLGQASLASHSYALITKLILKKCCNVEELIRFAVSMDASEPTVAEDPQEVTHDTSPDNNASHEEIPPAAAMDINMMLLPPGLEDEDYEQERSYMCQSSSPVDQMGGSLKHSPNTMGISPKRNEGPEDIRRWIADICSRVDSDALPLSTIAAQCQVILTPNVGSEGTHFPSAHSLSSIGGGGEDGFGTNHPIANLPKVLSAGMHFHELSSSSNEDEEDDERMGALHGVPNEDPLANSNPGLRWDSGGAHQVAGPTRSLPPRLGRVKTADQRCFSLTVFLSALRWNVGFTLWEDGHLEEAHDWLMSADIARLREIVKADEERAQRVLEQSYHNDLAALTAYGAEGSQTMTEGTDHLYLKAVADVCTHKLDWQGLELTTSTGPHASRHRDTTDLSVSPSTILLPTNAPAGLPHDDLIANSKSTTPAAEYSWGNLLAVRKAKASRRLLERLITLRDVSALITSCHTPKDAAFVVQRMGKAMGDLSRCQGGVDRTSSHLKASVPQDELEGFAAMLLTLSVLTEYVLAKCAREEFRTRWKEHCQAQHHCATSPVITSPSVCFKDNNMNHHGSSVSHSHAAHTLSPQDLKWVEDLEHASVRCACDDMVRQFTSGHYRSLHDLETQGLPPRDRVLTVLALGMHPTLAMNVLSTALNYVSLFRFSRVYRGVVIAEQVRDQREMTDAADLGPTNASTAPPSPTTPPPQGEDHSRSSSELSHGGSGGKRPASRLSSSLPSAVLSAARTGVNALRWGQQSIADYASEWLTPHAPPPPRLPADVIRSEDEMDSPNRHDDGRTLTLPSRRTVSLLPEEEVSELSGGSLTEEISLRLLTLIFRHHRPSLLAMEKIHVSTLYSVTNELNKAMQMLRTGMQLRFGLERFGQWSTEQEASTRAFYTQTLNELCEAAELQQRINDLSAQSHTSAPLPPASTHDTIERLKPVSSASYSVSATVVASPTATGSPSTLMASVTPPSVFPRADRSRSALSSFWSRPLYIPSDASMQQRRALSEGHPLKTEPSLEESASADHIGRADSTEAGAPPPCNANVSSVVASVIGAAASVSEGGPASPVVAWDMPVMFVPTVSIDFSAFTTTSLETQKATQEMIAQMQQQEAAASASRRRKDRAMNRQPAGGASSPTARYFGSPNASRSCGLDRRSGGPSVLFPECRQVLHNHLPLLQQYRNWRVIYNTSLHGISLQMMLLNCKREAEARQHLRDHQRNRPGDDYGCAMLLVMEMLPSLTLDFSMDSDGVRQARKAVTSGESTNRLFVGAYLNDLLRLETRRYYGNSDCFVFQLFIQGSVSLGAPPPPKLAVYRSSGANDQFVNCRSNSIVIGGGGSSSLYVAESLLRGSTSQCPTFNSPPLTTWASDDTGSGYSGSISFELLSLEVIVMD